MAVAGFDQPGLVEAVEAVRDGLVLDVLHVVAGHRGLIDFEVDGVMEQLLDVGAW